MKTTFKWDGKLVRFIERFIDISLALVLYISSVVIIMKLPINKIFAAGEIRRDLIIMSIVLLVGVFILFKTYKISITKRNYFNTMFRITISLILVTLLLVIASYINIHFSLRRISLLIMLALQILVFAIIKGIAYLILKRVNIKEILIVGPKEEVHTLAKKILNDSNSYNKLKYLAYSDDLNFEYDKIFDYIEEVDKVYFTEGLKIKNKNKIIDYCFQTNKSFYVVPKLYELSINNAIAEQAGDMLLYEVDNLGLTLEQRFLKRSFDLLLSIVLLVVTLPITIITALAIKISDRGPVFFKQERITINNKKFTLYKFRTMIPNAEKETGPVLATSEDKRITKLGKFLRASRIDELPQLLNIIKGDMSIVGPRPERDFFIKQFTQENNEYPHRLKVKAGVTGLAQALGTYNTNFNDKLRFDIYYITNYSFFSDINILLQTVMSIIDPDSSKGLSEERTIEEELNNKKYQLLNAQDIYIKKIV